MIRHILVLHGPNLNLLGQREPQFYGHQSLASINEALVQEAQALNYTLECYQSNHEGELVDRVQQCLAVAPAIIIINPAALTHTSVALCDALVAVDVPFIEVHLSNIGAREPFRHHSYFSSHAIGTISGFGALSYRLALLAANGYLQRHTMENKAWTYEQSRN